MSASAPLRATTNPTEPERGKPETIAALLEESARWRERTHTLPPDGPLGYSLRELGDAIRPPISYQRLRQEYLAGRLILRRCGKRGIVTKQDAVAWLQSLPVYTRKDQHKDHDHE